VSGYQLEKLPEKKKNSFLVSVGAKITRTRMKKIDTKDRKIWYIH
jgi:hypothetical protein